MAYENETLMADKLLLPDGSVVSFITHETVYGPSANRAALYSTLPLQVAKWLLPDGSIASGIPLVNSIEGDPAEGDVVVVGPDGQLIYSTGFTDALVYKGAVDCSGNPNYPAADAGHIYKVSVAGKIGGASGAVVTAGDTLICFVDGSAAGTQAAVGANWNIIQGNIDFAAPGPIGGTTPAPGTFTTLQVTTLNVTTNAGQGKILVSDADGDLTYLTLNNGINRIGTPGECGFGVGICPEANLPPGMIPMDGCYQFGHVNYGNYVFSDGSVMVYVPKFYYRMHTWGTFTAARANPTVITQTAHGYVNGDRIFIFNVAGAGMTVLNGLVYTVTKTGDDTYTIPVDSSGFAADGTGGESTKGFGADFEFNKTLVTYLKNSISIRGVETFANEAAANTGGYAMHRAFWDGNVSQPGFFFDKYKCSKNALGAGFVASSLPNGKPLSYASTHNPFADLTGGANFYYSTIDIAHRRDGVNGNVKANSIFHCRSQFQGAAVAMLATAHGQYSQNDTWCAWYSATTNYPKGCNNNALKDTDDSLVTYASDGYSNCGRTGSAIVLAKTTHNGQACGIADLNGLMYEPSIGLTCIASTVAITDMSRAAACEITWASHGLETGAFVQILAITQADWSGAKDKMWSIIKTGDNTFTIPFNSSAFGTAYDAATDPGTITKGTFYAAKKTVAMKSFTNGNAGATDHWGATGVAAMMDVFAPPFKSGFAFGMRFGSGVNQVLSEALSGAGWNLTGLGFPVNGAAVDATGTNLFGKDYFYQYIVNEVFLIACYGWGSTSNAGVWNAALSDGRGDSSNRVSLRVACYPV